MLGLGLAVCSGGIIGSVSPLTNTVPCTISPDGSENVATTLSAVQGTWTGGTLPYTFTYEWKTDMGTSLGTGTTYVIQDADQGTNIVLFETCNASATQQSSNEVQVAVSAPSYTNVPPVVTVSGVGTGAVLTVDASASFTGSGITLSYQWTSNGSNVGTNQTTYTTVSGDSGNVIVPNVTAANVGGSAGPEAGNSWTLLADPFSLSMSTPAQGQISGVELNWSNGNPSAATITVNFYDQTNNNAPTSDSPQSVATGTTSTGTTSTTVSDTYFGTVQAIGDSSTTISSNVVSSLPSTAISL